MLGRERGRHQREPERRDAAMSRERLPIVHAGRDGWLFLTGGTNRVLDQYGRSLRLWWTLRRWARLIEARHARAGALGIRYVHAVVPEKLTIYDDRTDGLAYDPARSPARQLERRLAALPGYVDLVAPMRAAREAAPLFRRTDTHWTYEGCLIGARALLRACGAIPPADLATRPRFESEELGDLAEKLPPGRPRETVIHWAVAREARRVYASPLVEAYERAGRGADLHVGAHVVYRNESPASDPRIVVLFGDSYAHYAPILLTSFLAECFRELHFVWSSSLDWGYIERVRPDILIFEMAERFLVRLARDDFDVAAYERPDMPKAARRAAEDPVV